jgi:Zn-dependent metalloprotease
MKKLLVLITLSSFIIFGYFYYQKNTTTSPALSLKKQVLKKDPWQTFEKKPDTIVSHKTTKKELKTAKLKSRKPASVVAQYFPRINGRRIYGKTLNKHLKDSSNLEYKNEFNKDWKKNLGNKLLAFQKEDVKLFIRKDDSFLLMERGGARLVEKVTISFYHANGMKTGYEAYVDSETGAVVKTWNLSRHENENTPKFKVSL